MSLNFFKIVYENLDRFTMALFVVVIMAVMCPAEGRAYEFAAAMSKITVGFLFFMHGAKLSSQNLWSGLTNWRLHLTILVATFVMFPCFGLILKPLLVFLAGDHLFLGLLFLCVLPSTVQSSIAFTSMAGGNVAAAVCAASASSLLGVIFTPVLSGFLFHVETGNSSLGVIRDLCFQLVLPFALGQGLRFCLVSFIEARKKIIGYTDRISILFIVYVSFSQATTSGLWHSLSLERFVILVLCSGLLLSLALLSTGFGAKKLGFERADCITILFCGSKKSLVTGVPMANIIFPPALAGVIILPLMIYHQFQLVACSFIAKKLAGKDE